MIHDGHALGGCGPLALGCARAPPPGEIDPGDPLPAGDFNLQWYAAGEGLAGFGRQDFQSGLDAGNTLCGKGHRFGQGRRSDRQLASRLLCNGKVLALKNNGLQGASSAMDYNPLVTTGLKKVHHMAIKYQVGGRHAIPPATIATQEPGPDGDGNIYGQRHCKAG